MNRQSIHQQIDSLLKIIHDQHDQIRQHPGSIPQVEIDFMIQNLRQLYEASLLLNHTNALSSLDEIKQAMTQKILAEKRAIELKKTENKTEPVREESVAPAGSGIQTQENKKEESPVSNAMNEVIAKVSGAVSESEDQKIKQTRKKTHGLNNLYEDKPTLGDQFSNEESLHLKIASKNTSRTLADQLHKKPISDLKAAIGINEKFLFVNKLFGGNLQTYSHSVDRINSATNLETARQLALNEIAQELNWDLADEHVKNFMELIERRFSPVTGNV